MSPFRITVLGRGIIGLSLALELRRRGHLVSLHDIAAAGTHTAGMASRAAAGMLAADDPHLPAELFTFAQMSARMYPAFLHQIETLSGMKVPVQTERTWQYVANQAAPTALEEQSIDPQQLHAALLRAAQASGVDFCSARPSGHDALVHCTGAWFAPQVFPRKGQMLRVQLPPTLALREVHRTPGMYIVPRTAGPQAGSALIGATDELAGFDTTVFESALSGLRELAGDLFPALADDAQAPTLEAWSGFRPATSDDLPMLGPLPETTREFVATGHYRNGILLAPATAVVMADLIEGRPPAIDLAPFSPARFAAR